MNTFVSQDSGQKSSSSIIEVLLRLFPLMFILAILPLIVRVYPFYTNLSQFSWYSTEDVLTDFFLHGKSIALNIMGIYMLVMLSAYALVGKLADRKPWILIPLAVFAAFAFASSLLSAYRSFAFEGIAESFESIWTILCYCLIVVYCCYMVHSQRDIRILLYSFSFGVFILTVIGYMQAYGINPLNIPWINVLTIPTQYREALSNSVTYDDSFYLTLYNPNYVGVYMAMTIPVMFFLLADFNKERFFSSPKTTILMILNKVIYFVLFIGSLFCMYTSGSDAGMLALCAAFLFIPIILYRRLWKHKRITFGAIAVVAAVLIIFGRSHVVPAAEALVKKILPPTTAYNLSDIRTDENGVTFTYKDVDITFRMWEYEENFWIIDAFDENGAPIPFSEATIIYNFAEEPYSDFSVLYAPVDNRLAMTISVENTDWIFSCYKDAGNYQLYNCYGKWVNLSKIERFTPLDGKERLISQRGYIWSRTIPLLKQTAVLGAGADCFTLVFPQHDYLGRVQAGYNINSFFSKPHSLYLQMAVQFGIPALLAFLVFFGMYFVESFRLYSKIKINCFEVKIGFAIFLAMIAYMITGITNDSMIVVSPLFWTLMGMGITLNQIIPSKPE